MNRFKTLMASAVLLLALALPAAAQTTLNSTTLAAAVTSATANQLQLASTTNVSVGDYIAVVSGNVVREIATVRAVTSPYVTVTRNSVGVSAELEARLHASGSTVYTGAKTRFYAGNVAGTCTQAQEQFLPHISLNGGWIFQCSPAGAWYRLDQQFDVACRTGALYTSTIDQTCWVSTGRYVVTAISYISTVVEAGGTLTVIPRKADGTEATASGDALATAISGVSTVAQTLTSFTLTATSAYLLTVAGDRLGLDFTDDVAGELTGVTVTFKLAPR